MHRTMSDISGRARSMTAALSARFADSEKEPDRGWSTPPEGPGKKPAGKPGESRALRERDRSQFLVRGRQRFPARPLIATHRSQAVRGLVEGDQRVGRGLLRNGRDHFCSGLGCARRINALGNGLGLCDGLTIDGG